MFKKIKANKLKETIKSLPRILTKHLFAFFMFLVFLALVFGGILFYKYSILAERAEARVFVRTIQIKKDILQRILDKWTEREERFNQAGTKEYSNPFEESGSLLEEEAE